LVGERYLARNFNKEEEIRKNRIIEEEGDEENGENEEFETLKKKNGNEMRMMDHMIKKIMQKKICNTKGFPVCFPFNFFVQNV
jgi:hypothetical protein